MTQQLDEEEERSWKLASEAGEKFSALYYRAFDKPKRSDLPGFFTDDILLLWNGNRVTGRQPVIDFFNELPKSDCTLHSLSSQPVHSKFHALINK